MKLSSLPSQPVLNSPSPRFARLSPGVAFLDNNLRWLQASRTREMFFEDFVGFGVMRTLLDLGRQYFFKNTDDGSRKLNFPAARERLIREVGSIITDNVTGGVVAFGIAHLLNRAGRTPNFSNYFASNETLELFQSLSRKATSQSSFLQALARQIDAKQAEPLYKLLSKAAAAKPTETLFNDTAVAMAKALSPNRRTLDVMVNKTGFALNSLTEDATAFTRFVGSNLPKGGSWQKRALQILGETTSVNRSRLWIGLGTAMGLTLAVPFINQYITRKVDKIESYPGELGLRRMKRVTADEGNKGVMARYFPYLNETLKNGNPMPLLGAMATLPFAFGMVDTQKLSGGQVLGALNLPFVQKTGVFLKRMANMMQFGKGFPFTTQQQMAACFAFLIFSRLITSRSDIEYRERMVDSFLGWSVWILATPFFKRKIAQWMSPDLLKGAPGKQVLKSRLEIERLLPQALKSKALGKYILLSAGSLLATLTLMGIVEPLIAIKWTERQSKKAI